MRLTGWRVVAAITLGTLLFALASPEVVGQGMIKVSFAQAQDILSFAPAYVARAKFFKDLGVDAQFEILAGGEPIFAAVSGGSTNFWLTASADLVNAASKGEDFVAIAGLNYQTIEVVVNKEWAQRKAVNRFSPLKTRIQALQGAIIASTSPGAITDTLAQYLLRYVGMEPGKDAQIVPLGGLGPRMAALEANRVQALLSSPPAGQQAESEGWGIILIPAKDLPGVNRQIHEVLVARKSWLARNNDASRRAATAIALGNNFLLDHFEDALTMHEPFFPRLSRAVLAPGVRSVRAQTIRNGVMKAKDWDKTVELLATIRAVDRSTSTNEGVFWTNEFVDLSRLR
ncbi:MAG: ABC transporter substrate-binding protein [Armatimonadota bacterium]